MQDYGRRLLRMFHSLSTHGRALVRGQSPRARRGRCHFQNKKGNSVSIRGGRTEQRRGFRSSNSKRTRLKKREGGKESYFHSVTRKGKREYPWVGDRLWQCRQWHSPNRGLFSRHFRAFRAKSKSKLRSSSKFIIQHNHLLFT